MNLSMRWLRDYVDLPDMSMKEFNDALTLSGSKVETYKEEGANLKNIVVGKILKIRQHPDADRLVVCLVDVAYENPIQIVTAAKNMKEGDLVPVALDGSILNDGTKIKKGKLRGILSQGMFCSIAEVGVTLGDFPYAVEDGLFILQEDCQVGQDIKEAIGFNDITVEFEITSNRPDCMSVIGLAREVAVTFDKDIHVKAASVKAGNGDAKKIVKVDVQDKDLCPFYSAAVVKDVKIAPSPRWMRERLRAMGVKPINNIVDITNYVMLEYGQPMHAFDLNDVDDGHIIVRRADDGESIIILDDTEVKLSHDDLIIADEKKPLALAGVMGGKFTGIKDDTKTIIFESANFKGSSVRISAKKNTLRTESSARFEKDLDPANCIPALTRALELVELLAAGKVMDGFVTEDNAQLNVRKVQLDVEWINKFLDADISREFIVGKLEKLGCALEGDMVVIPSFRQDIVNKYDLAEEVARFYGYNNIKAQPMKNSSDGEYTPFQKFKSDVCNMLVSLGISEAMTYSFISSGCFDKMMLDQDDAKRDCIVLKNPLGESTSVMRTTGFPSMMEAISKNIDHRNDSAKLFELMREYTKGGIDSPSCEIEKITIGMYGDDIDFFDIKGVFENLAERFLKVDYDVEAIDSLHYMHPGRTAKVTVNGKCICIFGQVHPAVAENFKIDIPVYFFELDVETFYDLSIGGIEFKPLPKFPGMSRDLCFICDENVPVLSLQKAIKKIAGNLLENIKIFDVYTGDQIPEGKKSVAFRIFLRSYEKTLTDDQVCDIINKIIKTFEIDGITLRDN